MDKKKRLNTKKHLIAYIDILSGKKLIQEDVLDENLNKVAEIYQCTKNIIDTASKGNFACSIDFKVFSDNILLTLTPEINDIKFIDINICNFFCVLAFIQMKALERNILLRGGLTIGDICINKTFAWGKGLLTAIDLEEKYAVLPRIIIDDEVIKQIDKIIMRDQNKRFPISQDFDGWMFIDYIRCWGHNHIDKIKQYQVFLQNEIQKEQKNTYVMQKLLWQASYCNSYLMTYQVETDNTPQIGGLNG